MSTIVPTEASVLALAVTNTLDGFEPETLMLVFNTMLPLPLNPNKFPVRVLALLAPALKSKMLFDPDTVNEPVVVAPVFLLLIILALAALASATSLIVNG